MILRSLEFERFRSLRLGRHWVEASLLLLDDVDSEVAERASERLHSRVGRYQAFLAACRCSGRGRLGPVYRGFRVERDVVAPAAAAIRAEVVRTGDGAR